MMRRTKMTMKTKGVQVVITGKHYDDDDDDR